MQFRSTPLRDDDMPPTEPVLLDFVLQPEDKKALRIGACAGVCFALAIVSAAVVFIFRAHGLAKAWAPKVTILSTK
jgi:hypothetical protein